MKNILVALFLIFLISDANAVQVGDTRTTINGVERCIDVKGEIALWTLEQPSQSFLDRQASSRHKDADEAQAKADAQAVADLKQQQQDLRNQAVDAILNGENTTDIKAQLDATSTAISASPLKKVE